MSIYKLFILLIFPSLLFCQNPNWQNTKALQGSFSGYQLINAETGSVVDQYQEEMLLNPASTMKVISCFEFLDQFGEDFQFETTIHTNGPIKNGTLYGDLIISGNGDPALGSRRFEKWQSEEVLQHIENSLYQRDIRCIDGNIIVDASYFGSDCSPGSWDFNDIGNYYAAGIWSVNFNENRYEIHLTRSNRVGNRSAIRKYTPQIPDFTLQSDIRLDTKGSGDQAYVYCAPYQEEGIIRGTIPIGSTDYKIHGAIPNGPYFFSFQLFNYLSSKGVYANSYGYTFSKTKKGKLLTSIPSQSSSKLAKLAIQKSINLYCEAFVKKMGDGDREKGVELLQKEIQGNDAIEPKIADGSGLSQRNLLSAKQMNRYLFKKYNSNLDIKSYLARSGYDGTLQYKFVSKQLKGRVYAKSGSMEGVQAYTGILEAQSGKEYIFTIIVNHYTSKNNAVYQEIEKLMVSWFQNY